MTPDQTISENNLPESISGKSISTAKTPAFAKTEFATYKEAKEEFEKDFIVQKLEENDWNISRTAEAIEIERSNLHRKIKSFGIDLKK